MTVYVDNMEAAFGRMKMCHCWADSREELFDMMRRIGVQTKWFQRPDEPDAPEGMRASWEHFDIAMTKRKLAVENGAVEVCMFTMAEHANMQQFRKAIAAQQWRRASAALASAIWAVECRRRRGTL
jgi:hypothetical protein